MRTLVTPSGRRWTVQLFYVPSPSWAEAAGAVAPASRAVLRFTAEAITLDSADWPTDWLTCPDAVLVELLRAAKPPGA